MCCACREKRAPFASGAVGWVWRANSASHLERAAHRASLASEAAFDELAHIAALLAVAAALGVVAQAAPVRGAVNTTVVRLPTFPFEAHSVNDLDAWAGLLAVGTRFIKLDVGVCDAATCETSKWSTFGRADLPGDRGNATRDCFVDGGRSYCCLCLRGDASTRPTLADPFNTSFDLVEWLASPPAALPRVPLPPGELPLRLGLDFGGSPGCGSLAPPSPCPAAGLISRWLLAMADAIASSGAAVVPYGDAGIGGLLSGLDAACGPGGAPAACSPAQRALQALPWPNEGGAPFDANDARERVFNDGAFVGRPRVAVFSPL